MFMRRTLTVGHYVVLLCSIAGLLCAQTPSEGAPPAAPAPSALPPVGTTAAGTPTTMPAPLVAPVDVRTYKIGREDILVVRMYNEPGLSGPVAVNPDGMIRLPMVGAIRAEGLTPEQLQDALKKAYGEFIKDPDVLIQVQAVQSKRYFVDGEVARPSMYPLVLPLTVADALSIAGGFRDFANRRKIIVLRKGKKIPFNYVDVIQKAKHPDKNFLIEDGDRIIVP